MGLYKKSRGVRKARPTPQHCFIPSLCSPFAFLLLTRANCLSPGDILALLRLSPSSLITCGETRGRIFVSRAARTSLAHPTAKTIQILHLFVRRSANTDGLRFRPHKPLFPSPSKNSRRTKDAFEIRQSVAAKNFSRQCSSYTGSRKTRVGTRESLSTFALSLSFFLCLSLSFSFSLSEMFILLFRYSSRLVVP